MLAFLRVAYLFCHKFSACNQLICLSISQERKNVSYVSLSLEANSLCSTISYEKKFVPFCSQASTARSFTQQQLKNGGQLLNQRHLYFLLSFQPSCMFSYTIINNQKPGRPLQLKVRDSNPFKNTQIVLCYHYTNLQYG